MRDRLDLPAQSGGARASRPLAELAFGAAAATLLLSARDARAWICSPEDTPDAELRRTPI